MPALDIDAATWAELSRLLDEALDLAPPERGAWLAALGPEHAALAPRLRELLDRVPATGAPELTLPRLDPEVAGAPEPTTGAEGSTVGPYRLVRKLGEGGMGSVWLAERTDGLLRRPVALKLPRESFLGGGLAARLARERDILAALEHPNVARLYDAGVAAGGRPFLALEYVDGRPVDAFAAERGLGLRERLRLAGEVIRAVAYAHGRLVVHRDLKPSNVLVTAAWEVKLLDFGVAKLLEGTGADEGALTRIEGRAFTPAYASPEQIAGEPIGVASDVYSLGVMLYELCAGASPYRAGRASRGALARAVLEEEPRRPSDAAADRARARALRGDLDAVILRALAKRPADRYPTADALGEDLSRWLAGRPVRAQPDRLGYRARKFVRRNRIAVSAAAVAALALVAGAGVSAWQARVARAEARRAEEVKAFVTSLFEETDPYGGDGRPTTVAELLARARGRIAGDLAGRPEVQVELLNLVGNSLHNLGDQAAGAKVLDEAAELGTSALGPDHRLTRRARLDRAQSWRFEGRLDDMKRELEALLPGARRAAREAPLELVQVLEARAHHAIAAGAPREAVDSAREALAVASARLGPGHRDTAACAIILALGHEYAGEPGEALAAAEEAVKLTRASSGGDETHPMVLEARGVLARALGVSGEPGRALDEMRGVRADLVARFGPDAAKVGFVSQNMVKLAVEVGELREAEESASRAVRILAREAPGSVDLALAHLARGRALLAARRAAEALPELDGAEAMLAPLVGQADAGRRSARVHRAVALAQLGRTADARAALDEEGGGGPRTTRVLAARAAVARLAGESGEALAEASAAVEAIPPGPRADLERMAVLPSLGAALEDEGRHEEAESTLGAALALLDRHQRRPTPERADALVALGRARLALGRAADALAALEQADRIWSELDPRGRSAGEAALWLGEALRATGREREADAARARARAALARSPVPMDARLAALASAR